tara:strand:- start:402 stop:854 length:453 start_codon:yes stop_codon:yes gene_type:complete
MSEDIYIRVDKPDTEFTKEEWDNPKIVPIEEQAVYDGRLFVKRLLIYQLKDKEAGEVYWLGFARAKKNDGKGDKEETIAKVKALMDSVITEDSVYTKNTLMKYVRENFVGNAHIKDVGKVVPKIVKQQLTRSGKWDTATKKKYIRLRKKG